MLKNIILKDNKNIHKTFFQSLSLYRVFSCYYLTKMKNKNKDTINRSIKKFEKRTAAENSILNSKLKLSSIVQNRYEDKYFYNNDGESPKTKTKEKGKVKETEIKKDVNYIENYYIPLRDEDYVYLKYFKDDLHKIILEGGKLALAREIENYNNLQSNPSHKISFNFQPLTEEEIDNVKNQIPFLHKNNDALVFIMQEGKNFLKYMNDIRQKETEQGEKRFKELLELEHLSKVIDKFPFNSSFINPFKKNEVIFS